MTWRCKTDNTLLLCRYPRPNANKRRWNRYIEETKYELAGACEISNRAFHCREEYIQNEIMTASLMLSAVLAVLDV